MKELDREVEDHYTLLVKATEDCLTLPEPVAFFDPRDDTLLKVHVFVNDINDNPPKFTREVFTGGITTESHFGAEIMKITVSTHIVYFIFYFIIFFLIYISSFDFPTYLILNHTWIVMIFTLIIIIFF